MTPAQHLEQAELLRRSKKTELARQHEQLATAIMVRAKNNPLEATDQDDPELIAQSDAEESEAAEKPEGEDLVDRMAKA